MVQTGYCPRGPFCAFAHVESKWQPYNLFLLCIYSFRNYAFVHEDHLVLLIAKDGVENSYSKNPLN